MFQYKSTYLFLIAGLLLISPAMLAQCSVCTQTAGSLDQDAAKGLNMGIIYLAMLPLSIILVIGYLFYKKSK